MARTRYACILTALFSAAACSSGPGATGPATGEGTTDAVVADQHTNTKPLEVKEKRRDRALILGTDESGGSTVIALAPGERRVEVDALYYINTTPPSGGSSPVWLTTTPQDDHEVRVGVYEQFSGGLGDSWRSAVWLSAFLSSSLLGKDLTDFRFTAEARGFVDGPSAGGLFTAGFLAAMTGVDVDPTATMTGIVNPDGTIGPVGGIPQKFLGSIKNNGKKRLGYPVGQRFSTDMTTGKPVDLEQLARDNGAEAFEIKDIYEAYQLMTGKTLPVPVAVDRREMALEPEMNERLRTAYDWWKRLLLMHWDTMLAVNREGKLPQTLLKMATRAEEEGNAAEKMLQEGLFATAYFRIMNGAVWAATAATIIEIMKKVEVGDIDGAIALFDKEFKTMERSLKALQTMAELKPSSIGGHLVAISGFQSAIAGLALQVWGTQQVDPARQYLVSLKGKPVEELNTPEAREKLASTIAVPVYAFTRGEGYARIAEQTVDIEGAESLPYECSKPTARRLAVSYSSAAAANLKYFETLIVKGLAEQMGWTEDRMRQRFGMLEPDYVVSQMALYLGLPQANKFAQEIMKEWGEDSIAWSLYMLSGSILSYFKSSLLISQWYSLGVDKDLTTGKARSIKHEKAFIVMITNAELKARQYAHSAKVAVGHVPIQARIHYQNATVLREGDLNEKLLALELYWASSVYSQTAVVLARSQVE